MIRKPYLLFLGDAPDQLAAKVAQGIKDWRPECVTGQIRLEGCQAEMGLQDLTVQKAVEMGAKTMVIGVANRGGIISPQWKPTLLAALSSGLDLASGLHNYLGDEPDLVQAAKEHGRQLIDVRKAYGTMPIANGQKRTGKRCLAVGTDVSIGKMYTTLAIHRELQSRGKKSTFRATGQTGILIEGQGVPLDAIVADFMAGSIEQLTPDNDSDHWDIVEGQGSLFHASYSGVTLALVHGSQPDALVLCHDPTRTEMRGLPGYKLPSLDYLYEIALKLAQVVNPQCQVIGVAINSSKMSTEDATAYLKKTEDQLQIPVTDPYRFGVTALVDSLLNIP